MPNSKRSEREQFVNDHEAMRREKYETLVNSAGGAEMLDRLARLFTPKHRLGPHVTDTGRALSPGRVTRASKQVRQRARGEVSAPLPIGMGAHPKRMTPTPMHPDCATREVSGAEVLLMRLTYDRYDMLGGRGLSPAKARYEVWIDTVVLGYGSDLVQVMTWCKAAQRHGLLIKLVDSNA